jgi:uncharacterized protein
MLIFAGLFTGLLVGLTGVGGGSLMTPILLLVFGIAPTTAVGTDLWFAALTKLAASGLHHSKQLVDWQVVRRLSAGSLPASALMVLALNQGWLKVETSHLKFFIGIFILVSAVGIVFQKRLQGIGKHFRVEQEVFFKQIQGPLTIVAGIFLGAVVTLTSIGAGAIGAVMLAYLYPLRLTPAKLVATDVVHAIPLAIFAGIGHLLIGNVDFALLAILLLGSIPGVLLGTKISHLIPAQALRVALAAVLTAVALKLIFI